MSHAHAALTPEARLKLARRVVDDAGRSPASRNASRCFGRPPSAGPSGTAGSASRGWPTGPRGRTGSRPRHRSRWSTRSCTSGASTSSGRSRPARTWAWRYRRCMPCWCAAASPGLAARVRPSPSPHRDRQEPAHHPLDQPHRAVQLDRLTVRSATSSPYAAQRAAPGGRLRSRPSARTATDPAREGAAAGAAPGRRRRSRRAHRAGRDRAVGALVAVQRVDVQPALQVLDEDPGRAGGVHRQLLTGPQRRLGHPADHRVDVLHGRCAAGRSCRRARPDVVVEPDHHGHRRERLGDRAVRGVDRGDARGQAG